MSDPPEATMVGEPGSLARRFWEAIAEDRPEIARDVAAQLQAPPVANSPAFSFDDGAVEDLAGESVEGGGWGGPSSGLMATRPPPTPPQPP